MNNNILTFTARKSPKSRREILREMVPEIIRKVLAESRTKPIRYIVIPERKMIAGDLGGASEDQGPGLTS